MLCVFQATRGLQTFSRSESILKAEVDDKSGIEEMLMLSAGKSLQQQGAWLDASSAGPPHRGTGVEPSQAAARSVNNVDYSRREVHATVNADFKSDSDVKPIFSAIHGARIVTNSDPAKAAVDKETLLPLLSADSRLVHEVATFDSGRRTRWLSGVSCTSSSTSGGEESPLCGSNSSVAKQHQGQTLVPVNGWSDSTSTPSQHVLKAENDAGQWFGFADGLGNSAHVDGISSHTSPDKLNPGVGLNSALSMERTHAGVGQDNRSWLSSSTSPQSRWNSRVQISEPFWAARAVPFHPQNEGMSSPVHSPRMAASQTVAVPTSCGFDGSQAPLSMNGSSSDTLNSVQMSQNVSPSTPLAPPSSKKRVCVSLLSRACFDKCL